MREAWVRAWQRVARAGDREGFGGWIQSKSRSLSRRWLQATLENDADARANRVCSSTATALAVPLQHRAAPRWEPSLITQVFFRFCGMPISARSGLPSSSSIAPYTCSLSIGLSFSKGFQHATSRSCLASFDIVGLTMEMRDGALSGNIVHTKETNNSIVPLPLSELGNG